MAQGVGRIRVVIPQELINGCFTLVEMLGSAVLLASVMGAVAFLQTTGNRSFGNQTLSSRLDALIDQDLAQIQALDRQFSCCTDNPCTADQSAIVASASCRDRGGKSTMPGENSFYTPRQPESQQFNPPDTPEMAAFRTACGSGGIASSFSSPIQTVASAPSPATLTRITTVEDEASNRLQLTYTSNISGNTVITRVVNLIPTPAAW